VYSKYEPEQNRINFTALGEARILQFDFE